MATIVIFRNGTAHIDLVERGKRTITDATLTHTMLSDDSVDIKVAANSVLDIRVNDYFDLFGERYRINQLPIVNKINNSQYEYNIKAQGLMYDLLRCKFFNTDSTGFKTTLDFPLIGDLNLFLTVIKANMQRFSPLWDFAPAPATETKTLTFGSDTCLSALQKICQEFKTDFWVKSEGGRFKIFTGAFGNTVPTTFEYGKGNGLYSLTRNNVNDEGIINRMYVQGGSENLPNGYRGFSNNLKFSDAGYLEDAALISSMGLKEGELKLDDIYPHRTGKVTALGDTKTKFIDNTMDFDLNEKEADGKTTKYLKPDTTAKIHFNTGNLAGYEFEIKKGGYKHATKEFEIIPQKTETGQNLPDNDSAAFQFAVGDEYVLLDIYAPEIYITNAEAELLAKATEQFALKKQVQVAYDLNVDPEFIRVLATPIEIGDYVRVKDTPLAVDKVIRINSIVRNFIQSGEWQEHNIKLTIADTYEISHASQLVLDVREIKNVNNIINGGQINYSLISLKTTRELQSMLFDPDGYFDASNIKPGSIETGMLSVGSQSQQLSCSVVFRVNADGNKNKVVSAAGKLFSQTFDRTWDIPAKTYTAVNDEAVYVYAKCNKTTNVASIHYDANKIKFDEDPNDYYFLLGILHSVAEGMRVLSITVGTTTINGGLVRAGIISSLDGQTTFNLNTGEITGKITFLPGSPAQTYIDTQVSAANQAAANAQTAANNAQTAANAANNLLADIAADNKVTTSEKKTLKIEWDSIVAEVPQNNATADSYGVSKTAYQSAYTNLLNYINSVSLFTNMAVTTTVDGATLRARFAAYYTERGALLSAISVKAKQLADAAQGTANSAAQAAAAAQATADAAAVQVSDIANDNKLTPNEKQQISVEWNRIKAEYSQYSVQAANYGVVATAYTNAYNALNTYITPLLANLTTTSTIVGTTFRANFNTYYTQAVAIITAVEKARVDAVQVGGRNLLRNTDFKKNGLIGWGINGGDIVNTGDGVYMGLSKPGDGIYLFPSGLEPGADYTLSIWTKAGYQEVTSARLGFEGQDLKEVSIPTSGTKVNKTSVTIRPTNDIPPIVLYNNFNGRNEFFLVYMKLEKGNKATDWTPAPEDIDAAIGTVATQSANALAQAQNAQNTAAALQGKTSFLTTDIINGNVIATGTLAVGDVNGGNAGITGVTDRGGASVRFWAGEAYAGKNTADWLIRDDGVEEQWFNGVLVRQRGVISGAYQEKWFNLNGQIGKKITFSPDGKILEEWYNNGTLVYQIGQNGIYYVAEIAESYTPILLSSVPTDPTAQLVDLKGHFRRYSTPDGYQVYEYLPFNDLEVFLYNAGQNVYSQSNKVYEGYKNTKDKLNNIASGCYVLDMSGWYYNNTDVFVFVQNIGIDGKVTSVTQVSFPISTLRIQNP